MNRVTFSQVQIISYSDLVNYDKNPRFWKIRPTAKFSANKILLLVWCWTFRFLSKNICSYAVFVTLIINVQIWPKNVLQTIGLLWHMRFSWYRLFSFLKLSLSAVPQHTISMKIGNPTVFFSIPSWLIIWISLATRKN